MKFKKIFNKIEENPEALFFQIDLTSSKTTPDKFNLNPTTESKIFINPNDQTKWEEIRVVDIGWDDFDIGFYKFPHLTLDELIKLCFDNEIYNADFYGAISIMVLNYPEELYNRFEDYIKNKKPSLKDDELYRILKMQYLYDKNNILKFHDKDQIDLYMKWNNLFESIS